MLGKKEKAATSGTTLPPLTVVRFNYPVSVGAETETMITPGTRNAQGAITMALDLDNDRVVVTLTGKRDVLVNYVPLSNVSSYC